MKRTYQPKKQRRNRTHGFLKRMQIAGRQQRPQAPSRQGAQAAHAKSAPKK